MDKRRLSKIPRPCATSEVLEIGRLHTNCATHIVTAELVEDKKILLLNFFKIKSLAGGNTEAEFRTFLSHEDYITQDLKTSKTKWITGTFERMQNFSLFDYVWDKKEHKGFYRQNTVIKSEQDLQIINDFF